MPRSFRIITAFAIVFLFFIQAAGTLVESIYILDLMNSKLDEKALGVLFFFTPVLLVPFHQRFPRALLWGTFGLALVARGLLPYLKTAGQVLASGLATFAMLSLFLLLLRLQPRGMTRPQTGLWGSAGLALAVAMSVFLRTVNHGVEYSLTRTGGWVGVALGLCLGWSLIGLEFFEDDARHTKKRASGVMVAILGLFLVLALVWFAFSAPTVIARWTEGNYAGIVLTVSLLALGWVSVSLLHPQLPGWISPRGLLLWNLAFTLSLTGTLLAHRVAFPPRPDSPPVVVASPDPVAQVSLALMLLLFPVIFLDLRVFLDQFRQASPAPRGLVPGFLLGGLVLILLIFAHIFTNVWGYVKPVSLPFRNMFWLPYFLPAGLLTLLVWRAKRWEPGSSPGQREDFHWTWVVILGVIFFGTVLRAWPVTPPPVDTMNRSTLVVMTFNTQQSNDDFGERSFDEQLALIRRAAPDILALQESDSARISLNNNDYVRYFAEELGYYSYYGPTTVTGTYGTALLSKYPLLNTRTVFTYSDKDEIGTTEAEIELAGRRFTVYNVHPDGSDTAMLVFATTLVERAREKPYVIALGDYNLRDYEEAYQLIDGALVNAWTSNYPSEISPAGVDMSGDNRIDHIFVSPGLGVRDPIYVLPPESATDHPVHWAEVYWEQP